MTLDGEVVELRDMDGMQQCAIRVDGFVHSKVYLRQELKRIVLSFQ